MNRYDFFIAYATPDRQQAQELCWRLQDEACSVFLDVQLAPGAVWPSALGEALEASRAIVVLVSTHTPDAFYEQEEMVWAIQLARDQPGAHTVIPVILEKPPQGAGRMPYGLSSLQARDATRAGGLQRVATELVAWLRAQQRNATLPERADKRLATEPTAAIRYPGTIKVDLCSRLLPDWQKLADHFDIPLQDRARFERGREPHGVWEWLELRQRLGELAEGLTCIERADLVELLPIRP